LLLLVGAVVALSSACSLRYDFTECESDGDCLKIEAPASGEYYQCVQNECVLEENRQCRIKADCASNEDCLSGACQTMTPPEDAGSDADTGADADDGGQNADVSDVEDEPDAPSTSCTKTEECQQRFGDSFYCAPNDECIDTAHPACDPIYFANSDRDEIILLGSIVPTRHEAYEALGTTIRNGVRMAVIEYASNAFDLPSGQTVAHLQCEGGSPQIGKTVAEHMKKIGVPFIVGPVTSSTYLEVVNDVTSIDDDNDGTFDDPIGTIAMSATSPAIGNVDSAGQHSFQIISNDRFQSSAIVDRTNILRRRSCVQDVNDAECTQDSECQANFGADFIFDDTSAATPCKDSDPQVAVFYKDDQYGRDLQSLLISRFTDRYPEATVEFYRYADPASLDFDKTRIAQEFGSVISSALSGSGALPAADQVLFVGTGETVALAKGYISALPSQQAVLSKRYIYSHGGAADSPSMFTGDQALPEAYMGNVESVAPNIFNQPYYTKWQQRYSITFPEPAKTSVGGLAYDAAYMGIFAMAGVPSGEAINGTNVTKVIEQGRLQNADTGTEIVLEENTSFPGQARQALRDGGDIDMIGVSGALDFVIENDKNEGTVRSNYLGLDIHSRETTSGDTVVEGVPRRVYGLIPGENHGFWCVLPCTQP
jgi:hypothetical protein